MAHVAVAKFADHIPLHRQVIPWATRGNVTAVHRADNTVYFKRIDQEAFTILGALRDGMTLSNAVDEVDWSGRNPEEAMADVQKWFAYWSAAGWFCKG